MGLGSLECVAAQHGADRQQPSWYVVVPWRLMYKIGVCTYNAHQSSLCVLKGVCLHFPAGCVFRALMQPSEAVVDHFRSTALQILHPHRRVIGLHRREGDRAMHLTTVAPAADFSDDIFTCMEYHVLRFVLW